MDVLLAEVFRILLAKHLDEVFAGVGELFGAADHERIVGDVDDALQSRHLRGVDLRGRHVADEEELGVAVVDDVVDLVGRELVEDGHGHRAIGEDGEEGGSPGRGVASAEGYLVAPLHARGLGKNSFGSTKSGIAPFYSDKYAKIGFQVSELFDEELLQAKVKRTCETKNIMLEHMYHKPLLKEEELLATLHEYRDMVAPYVGSHHAARG